MDPKSGPSGATDKPAEREQKFDDEGGAQSPPTPPADGDSHQPNDADSSLGATEAQADASSRRAHNPSHAQSAPAGEHSGQTRQGTGDMGIDADPEEQLGDEDADDADAEDRTAGPATEGKR